MRSELRLLAVALVALASGACTEIENAMATVPFLNFMHESPAFDPYEATRPAPAGSVPLESPVGRYEPPIANTEAALRAAGDTMTNPLPATEAVLARGREVFATYCFVCHGAEGQGNGPIVEPGVKFPMGPSLMIPGTVARSDGYIYAIIRAGRGLMPSYRRIPPDDRWAVVHYLRQLQAGQGAAGGQD